ncbi:MAG: metallopeptidase family protein [Elusimicrobiota bacterium]
MTRKAFLRLVRRAYAEVPDFFRERLVNLEISVRSLPGPEAGRWRGSRALLGLYSGLTRQQMCETDPGAHLPARIYLYQVNIESGSGTPKAVLEQVRTTLRHELAHHFGFSEKDLRRVWPEGA